MATIETGRFDTAMAEPRAVLWAVTWHLQAADRREAMDLAQRLAECAGDGVFVLTPPDAVVVDRARFEALLALAQATHYFMRGREDASNERFWNARAAVYRALDDLRPGDRGDPLP